MEFKLGKIANTFIVISIAGFLVISMLPSFLGLTDATFSLAYRGFIVLMCIVIIFFSFLSTRTYFYSNLTIFFLLFWLIYSIRMVNDLFGSIDHIDIAKKRNDYFMYAYGTSFLPSFTLIFINFNRINFKIILKWVYAILFIFLFSALSIRIGSDLQGRTTGDIIIGILFYGHYGASLGILSVYYIYKRGVGIKSIVYFVGLIIGIVTIFVSSSRSPFLIFVITSGIFLIFNMNSFRTIIVSLVIFIFLFFYFFDLISLVDQYFPNNFLLRLLMAYEDIEEVGGRNQIFRDGISEFMRNPIFGNALTLQIGELKGSYPHNLIVEALMSTGIIGGGFFILWCIQCLFNSVSIIFSNNDYGWVGLLFLQFFLFGMFSGNLYSSNLFWFFSMLVVLTYNQLFLLKDKLRPQALGNNEF